MANHLPPDTRAFSGQSVPGGVLLARADASGNLSTTNLQNGMLLMGNNWQAVPTSAPVPMGERIFLSFGKLLQDTHQSLLVTTQAPATHRCSAASLFTVSSIGQATEVKDSNLKALLENQKVEAMAIGALDQDTQPDVVYAADGEVHFLINKSGGQFELSDAKLTLPGNPTPPFLPMPVTSIAISDVDSDGKADVVVAQDKSVHIFLHQS